MGEIMHADLPCCASIFRLRRAIQILPYTRYQNVTSDRRKRRGVYIPSWSRLIGTSGSYNLSCQVCGSFPCYRQEVLYDC